MRRAVILVVGIAAGCFDPTVQPGSPCGENGACPGALVCVSGTCERTVGHDAAVLDDADTTSDAPNIDAMIDAPPTPTDNDGDGVLNMQDNCIARANADQHDEDNDAVGDVCDNCPHIANANQAAVMDNDTVGDACDPYPTIGGDSIVRFLPMHVVPPMISTMGTWQLMNDAYVHTSNGDSALIVQGGPWSNPTILVSGKQETNLVPHVWIAATVGEVADSYYHCGFMDEQSGSYTDFHRGLWGPGMGTNWIFGDAVKHFEPTRLAGAFTIRLHGNAGADEIDCTVNDSRGAVDTNTIPADSLPPGNVGIRSDGITYSVQYVVVFNR